MIIHSGPLLNNCALYAATFAFSKSSLCCCKPPTATNHVTLLTCWRSSASITSFIKYYSTQQRNNTAFMHARDSYEPCTQLSEGSKVPFHIQTLRRPNSFSCTEIEKNHRHLTYTNYTSLCPATYIHWQHGTAHIPRCCCSNWFIYPARRAYISKPTAADGLAAVSPCWDRQTDTHTHTHV